MALGHKSIMQHPNEINPKLNAAEAAAIVARWLKSHDLFDVDIDEQPVLDDDTWRVLIRPNGGQVRNGQEYVAFVDSESGIVTSNLSIDELRRAAVREGRTIWDRIEESINQVPTEVWETMPTDGAEQHDHYVYGSPKK